MIDINTPAQFCPTCGARMRLFCYATTYYYRCQINDCLDLGRYVLNPATDKLEYYNYD